MTITNNDLELLKNIVINCNDNEKIESLKQLINRLEKEKQEKNARNWQKIKAKRERNENYARSRKEIQRKEEVQRKKEIKQIKQKIDKLKKGV